jgi:hypothetical protein
MVLPAVRQFPYCGCPVIGGFPTFLFLTLIVVPVAYDVVEALKEKIFNENNMLKEILQGKWRFGVLPMEESHWISISQGRMT